MLEDRKLTVYRGRFELLFPVGFPSFNLPCGNLLEILSILRADGEEFED